MSLRSFPIHPVKIGFKRVKINIEGDRVKSSMIAEIGAELSVKNTIDWVPEHLAGASRAWGHRRIMSLNT